jgi:pimeloyl-ACP methyl ester carboxylesterase
VRIDIGDTSLYFDVEGAGLRTAGPAMIEVPTLLLLHGGPGFDHSIFKPTFGELADVAQVIYLDQRGQGRSADCDPSHWRMDQWVDDVAVFCELLGIVKPVVLGVSYGGFVAYGLAQRHPDLMGGMAILSSSPYIEVDPVVAKFAALGGAAAGAAARTFFDTPTNEGALENFMTLCMPLYGHAEVDPNVLSRVIMKPDVLSAFFPEGGEWRALDYRAGLESYQGPSLIIHGEDDPIVPLSFAQEAINQLNPATTTSRIIKSGRHDIVRDYKDEVIDLIRNFIVSVGHV